MRMHARSSRFLHAGATGQKRSMLGTLLRIGNSSGLRLPAAFYRDHPQFAGAAGQVEVLGDNTLLLRLDPEQQQEGVEEEESLMLGLFLDFLSRQALATDPGPVLYTQAMAADDRSSTPRRSFSTPR